MIPRIGKKSSHGQGHEWVFDHDPVTQKITISLYCIKNPVTGAFCPVPVLFETSEISTRWRSEEQTVIWVRYKMNMMLKKAEKKWDKYSKIQSYLNQIAEMDGNCKLK
jgi:hypothetical protein